MLLIARALTYYPQDLSHGRFCLIGLNIDSPVKLGRGPTLPVFILNAFGLMLLLLFERRKYPFETKITVLTLLELK